MPSRVQPGSFVTSTRVAHAREPARACDHSAGWPAEGGHYRVPSPVQITKALIWLMRDRGIKSPVELQGIRRFELEAQAQLKRKKRSVYTTFEASLTAAIEAGYIEVYEVDEELFYLPNYKRNAT